MSERMLINKKGVISGMSLWIGRIIITILFVSIIMFTLKNTIDESLDLEDLYFYPIAERFLYSNDCFVVMNDERPMPGIIDLERFNEDRLHLCMEIIEKPLGAKITLFDGRNEKVIYYNKERYDDVEPLTFASQFHKVQRRYYVLVQDDFDRDPGNLLVEVVWQE